MTDLQVVEHVAQSASQKAWRMSCDLEENERPLAGVPFK